MRHYDGLVGACSGVATGDARPYCNCTPEPSPRRVLIESCKSDRGLSVRAGGREIKVWGRGSEAEPGSRKGGTGGDSRCRCLLPLPLVPAWRHHCVGEGYKLYNANRNVQNKLRNKHVSTTEKGDCLLSSKPRIEACNHSRIN